MSIICPHCHTQFEEELFEEAVNPTMVITRKHIERETWNDVADLIKNGYAYRAIDEGDTISCKLKNGEDILIDVAGIDVYGSNEAIFCFHNLYGENKQMNEISTNAGGFMRSKMIGTLNDLFGLLPDDLQSVITPTLINQQRNGDDLSGMAKLWLPSYIEVFGNEEDNRQFVPDIGDKQLPIFKSQESRIRHRKNEHDGRRWWLRTFPPGNTSTFCYVYTNGAYYNSVNASYSIGVLPCFKISKTA